jgi:simple sugar transport system permease protein
MSMPSSQTGHAGSHVSPSRLRKATLWDKLLANGSVVSIALFFLVVCIVFSVITDAFLTAPNLLNMPPP